MSPLWSGATLDMRFVETETSYLYQCIILLWVAEQYVFRFQVSVGDSSVMKILERE